jgi:hypothetical protein
MQFHIPSVVQGPVIDPELEVPVPVEVEGEAGGAADEVPAVVDSAEGLAGGWETTVANTPPWIAGVATSDVADGAIWAVDVLAWGAELVAGDAELVACEALDPEPPALGVTEGWTTCPHEEPVGAERAADVARPSCSTESPGSGKRTSAESTVAQPLPMLARNMFGRALYAAVSRSTS